MRRRHRTAVCAVVVLALATAITVAPSAGADRASGRRAQAKEQPKATEIGVTADTIRIAVIADVNTPLAPGLFKAAPDAVEAWGKYINAHGGLAGRKVQVDFIDSKLSPDETRNAIIQACANDFATVGTTALFLNNVDDMVNCKDQAGNTTGLPDVPQLLTDPTHARVTTSFPTLVPQLVLSDPTNTTYHVQIGQLKWYRKNVDKDLHGVFGTAADLKSTQTAGLVLIAGAGVAGIKKDLQFDVHGTDPQDKYLPWAQAIKEHGSTFANVNSNDVAMAYMRKEAQVQGVTSVKVWDCGIACYTPRFLQLAGNAAEGQYVQTLFVPFEEAKYNKAVATYIKAVGGVSNASSFGVEAWVPALFFRDAVKQVVASKGVNGLTRANFIAAARTIHRFTADGIIGPLDVGGKVFGTCFALLQVKGGKFVRVYPKKPATFDCKKSNVVTVKVNPAG
ncbi:MAG TPA: ABC transporter substrate-binding protein [Acidimicrobiia bacterium]|nr:ABC transporter substrate-binding protein [Acidimicrobiia bacterium]